METKSEVKTIQIDYLCPKCEKGFLRPTGLVLNSYPPQYPHSCNNINCDYKETFNVCYPYNEYQSTNVKYANMHSDILRENKLNENNNNKKDLINQPNFFAKIFGIFSKEEE